jgi:putative ABC transport system substrate-binding protein
MPAIFCLTLLGLVLVTSSQPLRAQQSGKIPRIGFLAAVSPAALADRAEAFRRGLQALGYVEGKSIAIESRYAEGKLDRLPALAEELVKASVELIVTAGPPATRAAKKATSTIPIVMAQDSDPIGNGFIASLARPGANITGLSTLSSELSGKRLELLKDVMGKLSRVAVLGNTTVPGNAQALKETELAAKAFGVRIVFEEVRNANELNRAFDNIAKRRAEALLPLNNPVLSNQRTRLAELAIKGRLPALYERVEFVEDGGLMCYGVSSTDLYRRAATYVDKILMGAKPADLPVEQPIKFEFVVNLKAAKALGLTVPPNVLARADRVIR